MSSNLRSLICKWRPFFIKLDPVDKCFVADKAKDGLFSVWSFCFLWDSEIMSMKYYNFAYKSRKFRLYVPKSLFGLHVFLSFPSPLTFFSSFVVGWNVKVLLDGNGGDVE